jgi:hypothetical protein
MAAGPVARNLLPFAGAAGDKWRSTSARYAPTPVRRSRTRRWPRSVGSPSPEVLALHAGGPVSRRSGWDSWPQGQVPRPYSLSRPAAGDRPLIAVLAAGAAIAVGAEHAPARARVRDSNREVAVTVARIEFGSGGAAGG